MKQVFSKTLVACLLLQGAYMLLPKNAHACPDNSMFTTLYSNKEFNKLKQLHPEIKSCQDDTYHFYNFYIAQALYIDMDNRGLEGKAKKDRLQEIHRLNSEHWPTLYSLGEGTEAVASLASWKAGYNYYEKTLKTINSRSKTPEKEVPPDAFIQEVREKLSLLRNLVSVREPAFIPKDSARSGGYITRTRGSKAVKIQLPIRLDYDEFELKGNDLENAKALLEELNNDQSAITIVGHTDNKGSHDYNMTLSIKRATALQQFLFKNGYNVSIKTLGKGKTQPVEMPPSYAQSMSQDEIDMLNRRVEILYH